MEKNTHSTQEISQARWVRLGGMLVVLAIAIVLLVWQLQVRKKIMQRSEVDNQAVPSLVE